MLLSIFETMADSMQEMIHHEVCGTTDDYAPNGN
jgi:hypothetical protein